MRFFFLLAFLLLSFFKGYAEVILVTSIADSGPGTFREALARAGANGSASRDSIQFRIPSSPGTHPEIRIDSALPLVSSNLVIDGSTQPSAAIGITDARVIISIDAKQWTGYTYLLNLAYSQDIALYGLQLKSTGISASFGSFGLTMAIFLPGTRNITIGAPGKGNHFMGWSTTIGHPAFWNDLSITLKKCSDIRIQSNIIGIREDGLTLTHGIQPYWIYDASCAVGIHFKELDNVVIGGPTKAEGNLISFQAKAIDIVNSWSGNILPTRPSLIQHNSIGTDITGLKRTTLTSTNDAAVRCGGFNSLQVIDNHIMGSGLVAGLDIGGCTDFVVRGNIIGLDKNRRYSDAYLLQGILLNYNLRGMIGGPAVGDKNYIGYTNNYGGVSNNRSFGVTITRNSIFCHQRHDIFIGPWEDFGFRTGKPFITLNRKVGNTVSGTAPPKSTIEIFYDSTCQTCQTQEYVTSVKADENGYWSFVNNTGYEIVATATDTMGSTSMPTTAELSDLNLPYNKHIPASCGKNNGGTVGVIITSGSYWHWEDSNGKIISRDTNLANVGPGKYTLNYALYAGACAKRIDVNIREISTNPLGNAEVNIAPASCGFANGKIEVNDYGNSYSREYWYQWQRSDGTAMNKFEPFPFADSLRQVAPDDYYLLARAITDTTCEIRIGPFRVQNSTGPALAISSLAIQESKCRQPNGSITGLKINNTTGTVWQGWFDNKGKQYATATDLLNAPAGYYRFRLKDEIACDTLSSGWFEIINQGNVAIDTSRIGRKASQCVRPTGSIKGITVTGADTFAWYDSTGKIISTSLDLGTLFPGYYKLVARDGYGCADTAGPFKVEVEQPFNYDPTLKVNYQAPFCDSANGSLAILNHPDLPGYRYEWVKLGNPPRVAGAGFSISNLDSGIYFFFAISPTGCRQIGYGAEMAPRPKPVVVESNLKISPAGCNSQGSITGITALPAANAPFTYRWVDSSGAIAGQTASLNAGPGRYKLQVTDAVGCKVDGKTYDIPLVLLSLPEPRYPSASVVRNTGATLQVQNPQPGGLYELYLHPSDATPAAQDAGGNFSTGPLPNDTSLYVRFTKDGCTTGMTRVMILVFDKVMFTIPNAFSPNGDGINDKFRIEYQGNLEVRSFQIFDRYGQQVYLSYSLTEGWDGWFKGKPMPVGVYYWMLHASEFSGPVFTRNGSITLVR